MLVFSSEALWCLVYGIAWHVHCFALQSLHAGGCLGWTHLVLREQQLKFCPGSGWWEERQVGSASMHGYLPELLL